MTQTTTQKYTSHLMWFVSRLPVVGLLGYTLFQWKYLVLAVVSAYSTYIIVKNVFAVILDSEKIPKSSFKLLVFLDLWTTLGKISSLLSIDLCYTRSLLDGLMALHKPCPTTQIQVERVNEDVEVYVYMPAKVSNRGCLMYIHGGGWMFLSAYGFSPSLSWMSHYLEMVVVSVEYRLAPENPFPAGLTDCYNALQWIYSNQKKLDVDENKILVGGDSAGGNLSAALCLLHKDRKGKALEPEGEEEEDEEGEEEEASSEEHPPLAGQVLLYPVVQAYNHVKGSMLDNANFFPHADKLAGCIASYITGRDDSEFAQCLGKPDAVNKIPKFCKILEGAEIEEGCMLEETRCLEKYSRESRHAAFSNSYIFPLHSTDLTGLPPAYVLVATADTLKDEGEWYAKYLEFYKNKVVLRVAKNCHGFMGMYDKSQCARDELMRIKTFVDEIIDKKDS